MSVSRQRARDLVSCYDLSLEQQIVGRGCSLAVKDEELWKQVEELLKDGDAQEIHSLGLDPLRVMEESLKAAASGGRRVRSRGGLRGLAKAFEVLEQAALNLYLGPWREEYRVIKMYSGLFTHHITPVLSMLHIEKLFGLLGYQFSPSRPEQLRLHSARIGAAFLDDLLRLSCAFFVARCECRLLLAALGKHDGDAQWELSLVRERQRGSSLQVALENTQRTLEAEQPLMEPYDADMDLYQGEQVNGGGQQQVVAADDDGPHSVTWTTQSSAASPPVAKTHTNGVTSSSMDPDTSWRQSRRPCGEARLDAKDSKLGEATEAEQLCSCLQSPHLVLKQCIDCNALHNMTCPLIDVCTMNNHNVTFDIADEVKESRAASPQRASPPAMSSLTLHDDPKPTSPPLQPIGYHECCDLTKLNPEVLCRSCNVFHSGSCRERDYCQIKHDVKHLGLCSCGSFCSRKPLVLCRYCGNEYCNLCWYRNPLSCSCGQTFDQSSAV